MILSRDLLQASKATGNDKKVLALSTIHVTADGDVVACNGRTVMVVEAVPKERQESIPFSGKGNPVKREVNIPVEAIENILKNIPADKQFDGLLELVHLEEDKLSDGLRVVFHDGKGEKVHKIPEYKRPFIDFKGILRKLYYFKEKKAQFVLDRKRLMTTLQAMDKLCGDSPCYIEVTEDADLMIRSYIPRTGQRVMALVTGVLGDWFPAGKFEGKYATEEKDSGSTKVVRRVATKVRKSIRVDKRS